MLGLDHFGAYLIAAFLITVVVLSGYALYLWSRLTGPRRREGYSARNVSAAAPIATTAQPASSANGPSTP
jgi:HAMP domain-containing protein